MTCKYYDCGFCYAPEDVETNAVQGGCFEPEYCSYLTENKTPMTNQKDDLVCEIQDLQNEIDEYTSKISLLKTALERKEQQLNGFPITLQRIIIECMIAHNGEIRVEILENILDRVEVEMFPKKFHYLNKYNEGWNDCIEDIKARLRE